MLFKNQKSRILEYNKKTDEKTIRFDKGSPSPAIFSLPIGDLDEVVSNLIIKHPAQPYEKLLDQIITIEQETNDIFLQQNQIAITNGVLSGLFMVLPLLLNANGKVIVNDLCFEGTTSLIKSLNLYPLSVDYRNSVLLEKTIRESKAKVLFLNSPENPSGKIYDETFLNFLSYLVKKYDLIVISDEVNNQKIYSPYSYIPPSRFLPIKKIIVLNSFTKNYFLPGIRLGWVTAEKNLINKINDIYAISQVGINYPSQIIASYIIKNFSIEIKTYRNTLAIKKTVMEKTLKKYGLDYLQPVMAGTVVFVKTGFDSQNFSKKLLLNYNIGSIPGILFGRKWNRWMRLGFGSVSEKEIVNGITTIAKLV